MLGKAAVSTGSHSVTLFTLVVLGAGSMRTNRAKPNPKVVVNGPGIDEQELVRVCIYWKSS